MPGCLSRNGLYKSTASFADFIFEFTIGKLSFDFILPDNCTSDSIRFATSYMFEGDTIFITSVDASTENARCPCNFLIHAELEGLSLDRYFVVCNRIDDGVETVPYSLACIVTTREEQQKRSSTQTGARRLPIPRAESVMARFS